MARYRLDRQIAELRELEKREATERFTCRCVRLNREIGVFTSAQQEALGRVWLNLGPVSDTLSAERNCPLCHGSGILEAK